MSIDDSIKNSNDEKTELKRDSIIVRTSIIGIIANIFLASFKAIIGLISNSIAIVLDAVNNLSDAASSLITIIGTKLAGKEPDKKHPFGYGRIEYLTAMLISIIVLYAGISSFIESVKKIINPDIPDYSLISLIIVFSAVIVKIILGTYVKTVGKKVNSDSLINSGEDARLDSIISLSTLIAAIIFIFTNISLEAYLGVVISLLIIKSGIEMLKDALSKVLGESASIELIKNIKSTVRSVEHVKGAYDLILQNYGPDKYNCSIHIEIDDDIDMNKLDEISRKIVDKVYEEHNVGVTAVGIYSLNSKNEHVINMRNNVYKLAKENPYVLQSHGFYVDEVNKKIRFDIVISFDAKSRKEVEIDVHNRIKNLYKDYDIIMGLDVDFSGI